MIIFCLALVILIGAIVVNFLAPLKNHRVLIMSILAISMIMVNFINQVDIVVSPPQYVFKLDSSIQKQGKKQVYKVFFKEQFETKRMKYFNNQIQLLKKELETYEKQDVVQKSQQIKKSIQQLQQLPIKQHMKPIIKQQVYLLQQLKNKLIQNQDSIVHIQGIDKIRFELLMKFYIKDLNDKADSYGLKYQKIQFVPIYQHHQKQVNKIYKFGQKLSDKNYHYIVVFDQPSQKLINFLYQTYINNKPAYLTIIFLQLNQKNNVFPISQFTQYLPFHSNNYLQPINDYLLKQSQSKDKKQTKIYVNKIQKQLQLCEKYINMDYKMFLKFIANQYHKSIAKICYEQTIYSIEPQIQCLRKIITKQDQQIPYFKAKKCWQNSQQPQNIIKTKDYVKIKKQHFWFNNVPPNNFGLQIVTKKCSNQL